MNLTPERIAMRKLLFAPCQTKEELHQWVYVFLDLDLPDSQVDEDSNSSPMDMVWSTYEHLVLGHGDEKVSRVLYYSARGAGKTLSESVIEVLVLLHFRTSIYHLAAIEQQSSDAQGYLKKFFSFPYLNEFVDGDSKRSTAVLFYSPNKALTDNGGFPLTEEEWKSLTQDEQDLYKRVANECVVIVATLQSTNGKHGALLLEDELDILVNRRVHEEAANIPTHCIRDDGSRQLPITVMTSTRKTAFGLVQDEIMRADKSGLVVKHWNILDICESCPPSRHLPEESAVSIYRSDATLTAITEDNYNSLTIKEQEEYIKTEGYAGCLKNCNLFAACRGRLATRQKSTSKFLKPIQYVENQFKNNSVPMAQAQLLCWMPSQTGLIFPRFKKERHVITPHRAFYLVTGKNHPNPRYSKAELMEFLKAEKVGEWYGGMDFGFGHFFSTALAVQINNLMIITHVIAIAQLEPDQQLQVMEPFRCLDPKIWPDTENPQMISLFKSRGWRMAKWPKGRDSVSGGISVVQLKLTPTMNALNPELYFVHDFGDDLMMDLAAKHMAEFHYKLGADGEPTDIVADVNKDIPDAVRYLVMNRFTPKGQAITSDEPAQETRYFSVYDQPQYTEKEWMGTKISELTGNDYVPQKSRPRMQIESMDFPSYYDQQKQKKPTTKGKKSGIIWDLG